jgi:hypothetical protein
MSIQDDQPLGLICRHCGGNEFETERTTRVVGGVLRERKCKRCGCDDRSLEEWKYPIALRPPQSIATGSNIHGNLSQGASAGMR